jgi:hypothetical protein
MGLAGDPQIMLKGSRMSKMTSTPPRSPRTPPPTPPLRSSSLCLDATGSSPCHDAVDGQVDLKIKLMRIERNYPEIYYQELQRAYYKMVAEIKLNAEQSHFATLRKMRNYLDMALEHPDDIPQIVESMRQWNPMVRDLCDTMNSTQACREHESGQSCECNGQPSV